MGDLARILAIADLVFVGGSLAPIGGHSVIEPASVGKPVLIGPHYFNSTSIVKDFERQGALEVVPDGATLVARARVLRSDPELADQMGTRGAEIVTPEPRSERAHGRVFCRRSPKR